MKDKSIIMQIFGSASAVRVMREICGVSIPLSISQVAHRVQLSRPAVSSVLDRFVRLGIATTSRSGNAQLYQLNQANIYVTEFICPLYELEVILPERMRIEIAAALGDNAESIILFGSFARGDQNLESDVDILCVLEGELDKQEMMRKLADYEAEFYRRFGHTLSPLVYTHVEAATLRERAPALFSELEIDQILISGNLDWMRHE